MLFVKHKGDPTNPYFHISEPSNNLIQEAMDGGTDRTGKKKNTEKLQGGG